jgi:hypothetical protein
VRGEERGERKNDRGEERQDTVILEAIVKNLHSNPEVSL